MITRERTDEPVRELSTQHDLETVAAARPSLSEACRADAMVEQAVDGLAVGWRRNVHGTLVIGGPDGPTHPWRE